MGGFFGLGRRNRHERAGFALYTAAVGTARDPFFYEALGVPDTLDGRFDLVCLHAFLVIRRLQREPEPGPALAQAVFDAMFSDMDVTLREMGVGDLSVGRRVKAMWEAFNGRAHAYEAAIATADTPGTPDKLADALVRNVWRGRPPAPGNAESLARLTRAQARYLDEQNLATLTGGTVRFLSVAEIAA